MILRVALVASLAVACGGRPAASADNAGAPSAALGVPGPAPEASFPNLDPYPIVWTRSIPGPEAFDVSALAVDPNGGGIVVGGGLHRSAEFAGATVDPVRGLDGVIVRYAADDGAQEWVRQIGSSGSADVRELAFAFDGKIIASGEGAGAVAYGDVQLYGDAGNRYVAMLDGETGDFEWVETAGATDLRDIGAVGDRVYVAIADVDIMVIDGGVATEFIRPAADALAALPDGALAVSIPPSDVAVIDTAGVERWRRTVPYAQALAPLGDDLVVVASGSYDYTDQAEVRALRASGGEPVWTAKLTGAGARPLWFDVSPGADRVVLTGWGWRSLMVGDARSFTPDTDDGAPFVLVLDADGNVMSLDHVEYLELARATPDGGLVVVRGYRADRELVKLGPCPVERCSVEAW